MVFINLKQPAFINPWKNIKGELFIIYKIWRNELKSIEAKLTNGWGWDQQWNFFVTSNDMNKDNERLGVKSYNSYNPHWSIQKSKANK